MIDFIIKHGLVNLIKSVSILITAFIAVFYAISDFKKENSKGLKPIGWLIIILVIISITITLLDFAVTNKLQADSETKLDNKFIKTELSIIKASNNNTKKLQESNALLRSENDKLRHELSENIYKLSKNVKGADYKDLAFEMYKIDGKNSVIMAENKSKYPYIDGAFIHRDYNKFINCAITTKKDTIFTSRDCFNSSQVGYDPHVMLYPNSLFELKGIYEYSNKDINVAITIGAKNSSVTRFSVFRKTKGNKFLQSYRIYGVKSNDKYYLIEKGKNELNLNDEYWNKYFRLKYISRFEEFTTE
ncbi:hypothetical protein N4T20_08915 [Flavobacterium sp. TR2]|uniref:hypothetical protein n=1 Tax=Flavobacterium sp. TR2 TaxID=2977321 RepID=UPI0021B0B11A|nr:hypothetical protein [Flavobacterium sp. TR2]UWY30050.1 hypothetical protein N4T20_08915 [Flavobacterium sp. TR2]